MYVCMTYNTIAIVNSDCYFAENSDYTAATTNQLEFSDGSTEECFNISSVDDEVHEISEMFLIVLSSPDPRILFSSSLLEVEILDDDGKNLAELLLASWWPNR